MCRQNPFPSPSLPVSFVQTLNPTDVSSILHGEKGKGREIEIFRAEERRRGGGQ